MAAAGGLVSTTKIAQPSCVTVGDKIFVPVPCHQHLYVVPRVGDLVNGSLAIYMVDFKHTRELISAQST